jgi:hypothetical protein
MHYFDFHAHIILKQLFDDVPNIDARMSASDVNGVVRTCTELPFIIQTQIHQSQLATFQDEVLIGAVLHSLEDKLAGEVIGLQHFLKPASRHKLSLPLLQDIVEKRFRYFSDFLMSRTLDKYLNAPLSFNIVNKQSFDAPLPKDRVNVFFVVEGAHSLAETPTENYDPNELLTNLDKLLEKVKIFSINPAHLQISNLCNHAFGIQLTHTEPFFPTGNGLTDVGRKVIQGIFDRGIGVDVKHMSYRSRLQLRQEIDEGKFTNPTTILCSHTAFTGIPFSQWPGMITLKKPTGPVFYLELAKSMQTRNDPSRPGAPAFNSSSINLFNEEIVWIIKNGGSIGLSADRRILGYIDKFDDRPTGITAEGTLYVDKEFFSKSEWQSLGINDQQIGVRVSEDDCVTEINVDQSTPDIPSRDEYYFRHFFLQVKHYLQVCVDGGIAIDKASKHIMLGTDFDGLIDPFINMQTVEQMPLLKNYMLKHFRDYLKSLSDSSAWADQLDVPSFVEDFFYNNGFNVVKGFFQK